MIRSPSPFVSKLATVALGVVVANTVYLVGATGMSVGTTLFMMEKLTMGYYTTFELSVEKISEPIDIVKETVSDFFSSLQNPRGEQFTYTPEVVDAFVDRLRPFLRLQTEEDALEAVKETAGYNWDGNTLFDAKWYEHKKHMARVSAQFPRFKFTLRGEGEECGDVWKEVYIAGERVERKVAKIVFEDE